MSSVYERRLLDYLEKDNVTLRRGSNQKKDKMASTHIETDLQRDGSLFFDSILSLDETKDVLSMLIMADEHKEGEKLPSFYTSTQTGGRLPPIRPNSPPLSPLGVPNQGYDYKGDEGSETLKVGVDNQVKTGHATPHESKEPGRLSGRSASIENLGTRDDSEWPRVRAGSLPESADAAPSNEDSDVTNVSLENDLLTIRDVRTVTKESCYARGEVIDPESKAGEIGSRRVADDPEREEVGGSEDGDSVNSGERGGARAVSEDSESVLSDVSNKDHFGALFEGEQWGADEKIKIINGLISRLDNKTTKLDVEVQELKHSLEFSQQEVDILKQENKKLKDRMGLLETEDKRTQYQVTSVEDKVDRLETIGKKKNLLFEGVPEKDGGREDTEKTVSDIFDQLAVNKSIDLEACYRVGPYNNNKLQPRTILISFGKQADRDGIYAKRMDLKHTERYQRVWVNEDLGPISKRKRNVIRMISREAQLQGIDCRTGKYAIHIDRKKYDCDNLDDLPSQLHPSHLKQVQIDENTLAYQSEFAPLSNFFPCTITAGSHKFFCAEQAFQFVRAKTLNKPLAATKIFLSRNVRFIKQLGGELGTSDLWESRKFDVMYECLKRKFTQNPELKALLLKTGNMELVEATPDHLWGCGATLSSNVIRKKNWNGQNKHGKILMTVREELRMKE